VSIDRLFHTWYPRLVARITRRLGSRDEAEDVAQDAFIRLLDHEPDDPPAWLFTVAGRLTTDSQRSGERRQRLVIESEMEPPVDEALIRAEQRATVQRVLDGLPHRDRQLLLMYHDGMRYREIASQLGIAESSVGSLLTRAHRRFLSAYQKLSAATVSVRSAL
jgi:RNA polymerase sigma-70 factor (ECF subfamily)